MKLEKKNATVKGSRVGCGPQSTGGRTQLAPAVACRLPTGPSAPDPDPKINQTQFLFIYLLFFFRVNFVLSSWLIWLDFRSNLMIVWQLHPTSFTSFSVFTIYCKSWKTTKSNQFFWWWRRKGRQLLVLRSGAAPLHTVVLLFLLGVQVHWVFGQLRFGLQLATPQDKWKKFQLPIACRVDCDLIWKRQLESIALFGFIICNVNNYQEKM